jgi:hypothetical protein|tara:strand:+ start:820 stop:1260 length:441 start_codon:yes stop_codon:yes gene_type:complete
MEALWAAGARVQAYDPEAMQEAQRNYPDQEGLNLVSARDDTLAEADALVICTEWQHFRAPDFDLIRSSLKNPVIFNGRNLYDPRKLADRGFSNYAILLPVHLNYRAVWHMVIRGMKRYRNSRPRCISGSKRRTNAAILSPSRKSIN